MYTKGFRRSGGRPFRKGVPVGGRRSSGFSGGGKRKFGKKLDVSQFINKAIITEETEHFAPEHKFVDFDIDEKIKANITEKGYELPTPIQDRAIPHILRGDDVVGVANTGTGKTGAFLIPLINKVINNLNEKVLILAPTRELAQQIDTEFREFAKGARIFSVCAVGGARIDRQIRDLRRPHRFVIGTPGRVKDLAKRGCLKLSEFTALVLDEADRMLDMGFIADMREIVSKLPASRHTLFFSATVSGEIERIIKEFLKDPVTISVKTQETSQSVDQDVVRLKRGDNKIDVLEKLLANSEFDKVLIFGRTKLGVEKLAEALVKKGFKAESIHGDKNQFKRQKALELFKKSHAQVLVATDVAARGLDINGVSHVINYDLPETYEDYVHRIGRTGRAGKSGKALTFVIDNK
ncbi:MAG: DEAD/DEAH box helicase [bacterium]|nr:DEAD/DEAH box helicase [bacterium]